MEFRMVTRIWHGATPTAKSDEYLNLMRTVAIPDYRSTPGNRGAYALRRIEGDTAHFLMLTFYYDFDKDFLLELGYLPAQSTDSVSACKRRIADTRGSR
jgi:hypothetical protein